MKWPWSKQKPHEHSFEVLWSDDHAEIDENDPIRHTAFMLLACECRVVQPFPSQNFALTTTRYREALLAKLAEQNWRFDAKS